MTWRLAKSLETLRTQLNEAYPERRKSSDGTIGDEAHASRSSDHNPWVKDGRVGVVTAIDFTHDPERGVNSQKLADAIIASRDSRIKYVISNKKICASTKVNGVAAWTWRPYSGSNPHNKHMHLSVKADKASYDDTGKWQLNFPQAAAAAPAIPMSSETGITVARTVGGVTAAGTAASQVISAVNGPAAPPVEKVKEVLDQAGGVIESSKTVIQAAPDGFWQNTIAFVQSPKFLAVALIVVCVAWGLTYYLRKRHES